VRKLVVIEFVTLDGVAQGLGSPDEDRDGGFAHGGWGAPYGDDVLANWAGAGLRDTDAYLLGRRTYEKMAAFWPHQSDENPIAAHLNSTPKHVVTSAVKSLGWKHSTVLGGDVRSAVEELKAQPGKNIVVLGSGELLQTLIAHDLVDEYRILLHPLVLGTGKQLFRTYDRPFRLRLVDSQATTTGVLLLSYHRE